MFFQKRIVFVVVVDVFCHPDLVLVNDGPVFFAVSRIFHGSIFNAIVEEVFLWQFADLVVFG